MGSTRISYRRSSKPAASLYQITIKLQGRQDAAAMPGLPVDKKSRQDSNSSAFALFFCETILNLYFSDQQFLGDMDAATDGGQMAAAQFIDLSGEIHADTRGMSYFPWQGGLQAPKDLSKTFHLISIRPGHSRGNHYHPGHAEWLYPFHGTGILIWEEAHSQVQERAISGDSTLILIPPRIAHAVKNPGSEILYLLAWREALGEATAAEPETVAHQLVD